MSVFVKTMKNDECSHGHLLKCSKYLLAIPPFENIALRHQGFLVHSCLPFNIHSHV